MGILGYPINVLPDIRYPLPVIDLLFITNKLPLLLSKTTFLSDFKGDIEDLLYLMGLFAYSAKHFLTKIKSRCAIHQQNCWLAFLDISEAMHWTSIREEVVEFSLYPREILDLPSHLFPQRGQLMSMR